MTENTLAPVDLGTAQRIDSALRAQTRTVAGAITDWRPLIEEARDKGIYKVLGFKSWTAYIADVVHSHMAVLLPVDRLRVVEVLSREGMSQHAIATALDVNQATISRDQRQLMHGASVDGASVDGPPAAPLPPKVTGLDGKERRRPTPAPKPQAPIPGPQKPAEAKSQAGAEKQSEKADRKAQRAAWMADNDELTRRNAELAKANAELTKKIAKARENLGAACKQVAELKAELSERDQLIAELREELKLAKAKAPTAKATESQEDWLLRGVLAKLSGGPMANSELCGKFSGDDRPALAAALGNARAAGLIVSAPAKRNSVIWSLAPDSEKAPA